jgi:hypothetical protein
MNNREIVRERIQESKRACLLKKIKFFEYLINFAGPEPKGAFITKAENKTANLFFPTI